MAIMNWLQRVRGQQTVSGTDNGIDSRDDHPKYLESTMSIPVNSDTSDTLNTPRSPRCDTPSTLMSTLTEDQKQHIEPEVVQHQFGRLASWRGALVLFVTSGSQFLDNVFMTSSNVALASIQEEFKVSSTNLQWMISAYTLAFGGFLLLAGCLSDR